MPDNPLISSLRNDYPHLNFRPGPIDRWSASTGDIDYSQPVNPDHVLHEVGHALLRHNNYQLDIELLKIEADAWAKAREIAPRYGYEIKQIYINDCLETYKQWLLRRSRCPECQLVGIQNENRQYSCPNCQLHWKVSADLGCELSKARVNGEPQPD